MKTRTLILLSIAFLIACLFPSCVTYKGKYGTYTATPQGIVIVPYYAK